MEYELLIASTAKELNKSVKRYLNNGWNLYGPPVAYDSSVVRNAGFGQAVTKPRERVN